MKRGKELKYWSILVTVVTAGILTLSIANNANFKLFAEHGAGGYTCYIPEDETEIRELIIDNELNNGAIYKTRGTVTRVQENGLGRARAFIQRTNGEDGSKSSLMLTEYNVGSFNVAAGNVIDVDGGYHYENYIPQLKGNNSTDYGATVVEEVNQNPVEAWEMSVDDFKYNMHHNIFTYRDISRLVTLPNVNFGNQVEFGQVESFTDHIYLPYAISDSGQQGHSDIETMSVVLSTYNTSDTNALSAYLAEHSQKNAIFNLTGVITFLRDGGGSQEYALMLVDINDADVVSENSGGEGNDPEDIIEELEDQLHRPLTNSELEALPLIFALIEELKLDGPEALMGSDAEINVLLAPRVLSQAESAALVVFRALLIELQNNNTIDYLKDQLKRDLTQEEINAVPYINALMTELGLDSPGVLMGSDEQINELLTPRELSAAESAALVIFRGLMEEINNGGGEELDPATMIAEFERELDRELTQNERMAIPYIIALMGELETNDQNDLMVSDAEINGQLEKRTLMIDERAALLLFRIMMNQIQGDTGGHARALIDDLERILDRELNRNELGALPFILDLMAELNNEEPSALLEPNEELAITLDRDLLNEEINALTVFRQIISTGGEGGIPENIIAGVENQLGRAMNETELAALPLIFNLTAELDLSGPHELMMSDEEIEEMLDERHLSEDEKAALVVFRALMQDIITMSSAITAFEEFLEITLGEYQRQYISYAIIIMNELGGLDMETLEDMRQNEKLIEIELDRPLSAKERIGLDIIREIMNEIEQGGDPGGDDDDTIAFLEYKLKRSLTAEERAAVPFINALMAELKLNNPEALMASDEQINGMLEGRELSEDESAALFLFRAIMQEIEIKEIIANIESDLGRDLTAAEIGAIPVINALMSEPGIQDEANLMGSDAEIVALIKRPLTGAESAALVIYRALFTELQNKNTIDFLEEQLDRELDEDERDAVPYINALMAELNLASPEILMGSDAAINNLLAGRVLSEDESAALVIFRRLMNEINNGGDPGGGAEVTINDLEDQLGRDLDEDELNALPLINALIAELKLDDTTSLMTSDAAINNLLKGRVLSEDESEALVLFRAIMHEIEIKDVIDDFEYDLDRPLARDERTALIGVQPILNEIGTDNYGYLLIPNSDVVDYLGRPLTDDEKDALNLVRWLYAKISTPGNIEYLEYQLNRILTADERDALEFGLRLYYELRFEHLNELVIADAKLEAILGWSLSTEEKATMDVYRALIIELEVKQVSANLEDSLERDLTAAERAALTYIRWLIHEGDGITSDDLLVSDSEIELLLDRELSGDEKVALAVYRLTRKELEAISVINNLQNQLGRDLTAEERTAMAYIKALMDELSVWHPNNMPLSDSDIEAQLDGRELTAEEKAALVVFRELMFQIKVKQLISDLENSLGSGNPLNAEEKAAMVYIQALLDEFDYSREFLMSSDDVIEAEFVITLSAAEKDALSVFRAIIIRIQVRSIIINFEYDLKRDLEADERAALIYIQTLMYKLDDFSPDHMLADDAALEVRLGDDLSLEEKAALVIYRSLLIEQEVKRIIGEFRPELDRDFTEDELAKIELIAALLKHPNIWGNHDLFRPNSEIVELIGRPLSAAEESALVMFRELMIIAEVNGIIPGLEEELGRDLEQDELAALPFIRSLMHALYDFDPNKLLLSDTALEALLGTTLSPKEKADLVLYRAIVIEIEERKIIAYFEYQLNRDLTAAELAKIPYIAVLIKPEGIYGNNDLMRPDSTIEERLNRSLSAEEKAALITYRGLIIESELKGVIANFKEGLGRDLDEDELAALPFIQLLMHEFGSYDQTQMLVADETIEELLNRTLSGDEKAALVTYRALMKEIEIERIITNLQAEINRELTALERAKVVYIEKIMDDLNDYDLFSLTVPDAFIEERLGRSLTAEESDALMMLREMLGGEIIIIEEEPENLVFTVC